MIHLPGKGDRKGREPGSILAAAQRVLIPENRRK
jgi:hypothetical protein